MDALELLKTDHKTVKELFKKAEGSENKKQQLQLFEKIKTVLETHTHIEETVFYPAVAKNEELKDMVLESLEEHKQVKTLPREMAHLLSESKTSHPKLNAMSEHAEDHTEEEEEGKMCPKIRQLMTAEALEQLGRQLE